MNRNLQINDKVFHTILQQTLTVSGFVSDDGDIFNRFDDAAQRSATLPSVKVREYPGQVLVEHIIKQ